MYQDDEAQGPCIDTGIGAAWVEDADLESPSFLPSLRPERGEYWSTWDYKGVHYRAWVEFLESVNLDGEIMYFYFY